MTKFKRSYLTMMTTLLSILVIVTMSSCSTGDSINGNDAQIQSEPLWMIQGSVQDAGDVPANQLTNVYAAIVWQKIIPRGDDPMGQNNGGYQVAQTLPVDVNFPISFEMGMYELPPQDILYDGELSEHFDSLLSPLDADEQGVMEGLLPYKWAIGYLVMFQDGNDNGILDMSADGTTFVDSIIGSASERMLLYIESEHEHPVFDKPEFSRGLSILKGLARSIDGAQSPLTEPVEITLGADLLNQAFMCPNGHSRLDMTGGYSYMLPATCEVVAAADLPNHFPGMVINGRDGFCDGSKRSFTWYVGASSYPTGLDDLCGATPWNSITGFKVSVLDENEVIPSWWPCNDDTTHLATKDSLVYSFVLNSNDYQRYLNGELTQAKFEACAAGNWEEAKYDDGTIISAESCGLVFDDWVACSAALEDLLLTLAIQY